MQNVVKRSATLELILLAAALPADPLADRDAARAYNWKLSSLRKTALQAGIAGELEALTKSHREAAILKFGVPNPDHPDCHYCIVCSVFGGPNHNAMSGCTSGRKPHCTCDGCF